MWMPVSSWNSWRSGMRDEMQGVFVLRAVGNGVHGPGVGVRIVLQPTLEQDDQLAFPGRRRTVEQQDAPPDIRAHGGRFKIFHHSGQGFIDTEQIMLEEGIVFFALLIDVAPRRL